MLEEDYDDMDESKRQTRNRNEKKRRDQFNVLVNELSSMVCTGTKKTDKSSVLKTAISYLKHHNEAVEQSREHNIHEDWKPAFLSNEEFTYLVLEALDGFLIVFSETGTIYYASESMTSLLGHLSEDVVKMSFPDMVADEDRRQVEQLLDNAATGCEVKFQCRMRKRPLNMMEGTSYQHVQFTGFIQENKDPLNGSPNVVAQRDNPPDKVFVCTGRVATPQLVRADSLGGRREFSSRHSLEWKFLFVDHRAAAVIGYLPFEVLGTSGYDYYHRDDLHHIALCHQQLMQTGAMTSGYYRFLTKGHQWVWLQTCFFITYNQWNSKPEFIMCTHQVVSYKDVLKESMNDDIKTVERRRRRRAKTLAEGEAESSYTLATDTSVKVPQTPLMTMTALVSPDVYSLPFLYPGPMGPQPVPVTAHPTMPDHPYQSLEDHTTEENNQEQLQRKHHHLQQVIVRQQEELKRVKQQLLLAKLGIASTTNEQQQFFGEGSDITFQPNHQNQFLPN